MKTKRTVFEVNDVYRVMENSELIYTLTNSEKLKREEYKYEQMEIEGLCLSDVLETLTPSRKKVAYAAIELVGIHGGIRKIRKTVNVLIAV